MDDVELLVGIKGSDDWRRQRDEDQKRQDAGAARGRPVAEEAAPALAAQSALSQDADGFGRDDERDEQCQPVAERHPVATSTSASARTRRRGSATPSRMSASRLPA